MATSDTRRLWGWGCLLIFWPLSLIGCVNAQQKVDDELASRIDQALLASDELNLSRIEVSAESGLVYLSGMSDDHASKVHAEKKAQAIPGVQKIINKIEVDF
jgi:osmotically-inducible protein OsmY